MESRDVWLWVQDGEAKTFSFKDRQWIYFQDEVIFQKEEAYNGEEVDEDESQKSRQQNGASVSCHTFDDIK